MSNWKNTHYLILRNEIFGKHLESRKKLQDLHLYPNVNAKCTKVLLITCTLGKFYRKCSIMSVFITQCHYIIKLQINKHNTVLHFN